MRDRRRRSTVKESFARNLLLWPAGVLDRRQHVLVREKRLRSRGNVVGAQEKREDIDVLVRLQTCRWIVGRHLLHALEQFLQRRVVPPLRERFAGERGRLLAAFEIVAVALGTGAIVEVGAARRLRGCVDAGPHGFCRLREERREYHNRKGEDDGKPATGHRFRGNRKSSATLTRNAP